MCQLTTEPRLLLVCMISDTACKIFTASFACAQHRARHRYIYQIAFTRRLERDYGPLRCICGCTVQRWAPPAEHPNAMRCGKVQVTTLLLLLYASGKLCAHVNALGTEQPCDEQGVPAQATIALGQTSRPLIAAEDCAATCRYGVTPNALSSASPIASASLLQPCTPQTSG